MRVPRDRDPPGQHQGSWNLDTRMVLIFSFLISFLPTWATSLYHYYGGNGREVTRVNCGKQILDVTVTLTKKLFLAIHTAISIYIYVVEVYATTLTRFTSSCDTKRLPVFPCISTGEAWPS